MHLKCSYYSKNLLRQRCLTIIIPIIIAVGSTIIIPATTIFASVTITHYAFFLSEVFGPFFCFSAVSPPLWGVMVNHCRAMLGRNHRIFFSTQL